MRKIEYSKKDLIAQYKLDECGYKYACDNCKEIYHKIYKIKPDNKGMMIVLLFTKKKDLITFVSKARAYKPDKGVGRKEYNRKNGLSYYGLIGLECLNK